MKNMLRYKLTLHINPTDPGIGLTTRILNVSGPLFSATNPETPLLNRIQGRRSFVTSKLFVTNSDYTLRPATQPEVSEQGSLTAPNPEFRTRDQSFNVVQPFHNTVATSYIKQANMGLLAGITSIGGTNSYNAGDANNIATTEQMNQLALALRAIRRDMEYTIINGVYNLAANETQFDKTRGLIQAITTNHMSNTGALTAKKFNSFMFMGRQNNVATGDILLVGSSATKMALQEAFPEQPLPMSRREVGTDFTVITTAFGTFEYELNDFVPNGTILYIHLPSLGLKEMNTPGKGNFFVEQLAKTGAKESEQIFGLMGLDYGAEWNHMKMTGITIPANFDGVVVRDITRTGRTAKNPANGGVTQDVPARDDND